MIYLQLRISPQLCIKYYHLYILIIISGLCVQINKILKRSRAC